MSPLTQWCASAPTARFRTSPLPQGRSRVFSVPVGDSVLPISNATATYHPSSMDWPPGLRALQVELPGLDLQAAGRVARAAAEAVRAGVLGYTLLTAIRDVPHGF